MGSEVLSSQCASLVRAIYLVILCWHLNTTFAHISCPGAFDQRKCSTKRSADIAQRELMWWERAEMGKEANGLAALSRQCFTQCPCTYTALAILRYGIPPLIHLLTLSHIHPLTHPLMHSLIHPLIRSLMCSLVRCLIHSLVHSLIHPLIYPHTTHPLSTHSLFCVHSSSLLIPVLQAWPACFTGNRLRPCSHLGSFCDFLEGASGNGRSNVS